MFYLIYTVSINLTLNRHYKNGVRELNMDQPFQCHFYQIAIEIQNMSKRPLEMLVVALCA